MTNPTLTQAEIEAVEALLKQCGNLEQQLKSSENTVFALYSAARTFIPKAIAALRENEQRRKAVNVTELLSALRESIQELRSAEPWSYEHGRRVTAEFVVMELGELIRCGEEAKP